MPPGATGVTPAAPNIGQTACDSTTASGSVFDFLRGRWHRSFADDHSGGMQAAPDQRQARSHGSDVTSSPIVREVSQAVPKPRLGLK